MENGASHTGTDAAARDERLFRSREGPRKAPSVCVVIVNCNGGPHLARCIEALRRQTFRDFEVILVDNGSSDGSIEALGALPPGYRLLRAEQNLGFAKANNLAAKDTSAPWLATLNVDAYPEPDWLEKFMQAVERYPEVVMFGSIQIDLRHPDRLDGSGDFYHATGVVWRGNQGHPLSDLADEGEAFGPCAAAALYRREAFLAAGGFDERFFCYCEDIDLAFRLRLVGATCIQVPDAVVRHVGSGVTGRRSDFTVYHGTRNRLWTFVKDMPGPLFWPLLPAHLLANLAFLLLALAEGTFRATGRGLIDGVRGIGPIWAARRQIQRGRRASVGQIARALTWSPVALLRRAANVRPVTAAGTKTPAVAPLHDGVGTVRPGSAEVTGLQSSVDKRSEREHRG